jgi:hypothetical protein
MCGINLPIFTELEKAQRLCVKFYTEFHPIAQETLGVRLEINLRPEVHYECHRADFRETHACSQTCCEELYVIS